MEPRHSLVSHLFVCCLVGQRAFVYTAGCILSVTILAHAHCISQQCCAPWSGLRIGACAAIAPPAIALSRWTGLRAGRGGHQHVHVVHKAHACCRCPCVLCYCPSLCQVDVQPQYLYQCILVSARQARAVAHIPPSERWAGRANMRGFGSAAIVGSLGVCSLTAGAPRAVSSSALGCVGTTRTTASPRIIHAGFHTSMQTHMLENSRQSRRKKPGRSQPTPLMTCKPA